MPPKIAKAAAIEGATQQLLAKTKLLKTLLAQSEVVITGGNERKVKRSQDQIRTKIDESFALIAEIAEMKLLNDEDETAVSNWTLEQEYALEIYEAALERFEAFLKDVEAKAEETVKAKDAAAAKERQKQELVLEEEKFQRKKALELELEAEKLKRTQELQSKAKLRRLKISDFDGTFLDWTRFWEQFEEEVHRNRSYAPITKFSFLREYLTEQPKSEISGLPFNEAGYEKAVEVLKKKYGVTSEIVHAHGKNILKLANLRKDFTSKNVHEFYRSLNVSVNSLKTLGKLDAAEILTRETLEKLDPIKAELTRNDADWQEWNMEQLLDSLREYVVRHPEKAVEYKDEKTVRERNTREKTFRSQNKDSRKIRCIYCDSVQHFSSDCGIVRTRDDRRAWFRKKKLCYNCAGTTHAVRECKSRSCGKCNQRHHTSLCNLLEENVTTSGGGGAGAKDNLAEGVVSNDGDSKFMLQNIEQTIHPTLVGVVNGQKFRMLLDTGAGSSFISSTLASHLGCSPSYWEDKAMETMTSVVRQRLPVYNIQIHSTDKKHALDLKVNKLDRPTLTVLTNPNIKRLKNAYPYLDGLVFDNEDDKKNHPIHVILGAGEIAKIKRAGLISGKSGDPVAEKTSFGWTLMGQGDKPSDINYISNTVHDDYQQLYNLDVLGLHDEPEGDQQNVFTEFKEQLQRKENGAYSTGLPWIACHPELNDNSSGAMARFHSLLRRLKKSPELLREYHNIMQQQLVDGILEIAPDEPSGEHVYYMPHRAVVKETAETTKVRIVYDASASEGKGSASLNDCLHAGPPLQTHMLDILIRNRMKPIALLADIKQAFLQIWIDERDRDAFRLYWVKDLKSFEKVTLRFTRPPFGATSSPFILGGTLHEHFQESKELHVELRAIIEELERALMVDDLVSGGTTEREVCRLKETAIKIFKEGQFELHKFHSNIPTLETERNTEDRKTETKILGVYWDKKNDMLGVDFSGCKEVKEVSKRGILKATAKIYDLLNIASPLVLVGKLLYREACDLKIPWDAPLPQDLDMRWKKWLKSLPDLVLIPRSIPRINLKITAVELHGFGDASKVGCCSAIYVVVHQQGQIVSCRLLTSNSRIAKRDLSIPRLELVSGHMVANSLHNVRESLVTYPIKATYGWLDSAVALYWIRHSPKEWKQFVSNRVEKIKSKRNIEWRHCPSTDNPADIGSRGTNSLPDRWFQGPEWLMSPENWPYNIVEEVAPEEATVEQHVQKVFLVVEGEVNPLNDLLEKFSSLTKLLRVTAWIKRYVYNLKEKKKEKGGLSPEEIMNASKFWIRNVQGDATKIDNFEQIARKLDIVENNEGLLACRGRLSGEQPIFLPSLHKFTNLVIKDAHWRTSHGLIGLTMAEVRRTYWIDRLRSRVNSILNSCSFCHRYHRKPYANPPNTTLPDFRTSATRAFENTGVDFAGPIEYKAGVNYTEKAYIVLYTCAASRAVHLGLLEDTTTDKFRHSLKEFMARRGNPALFISDNAKTFVNTAKWLQKVMRDPEVVSVMANAKTRWKFNLSRSPWWGGFFERMIGLTKRVLYKALGRARLSFKALQEVLLDTEVTLNNRPLGYLENDIQLPTLTPNMIIHGTDVSLPVDEIDEDPDVTELEPTKLAKHLKRCKDAIWKRWNDEYLRALRERHNCATGETNKIKVGDIVLIKGENRNRAKWNLGVVTKLIEREGVILGAKLKTKMNTVLERSVKQLYPMELHTESLNVADISSDESIVTVSRPTREAKSKASDVIRSISAYELEEK